MKLARVSVLFVLALAACQQGLTPAPTLPPPFSGTGPRVTERFYLAVSAYTVAWTARSKGTEPCRHTAVLEREVPGVTATIADTNLGAGQTDGGITGIVVDANWYLLSVSGDCEWTAYFKVASGPQ